jgi:hypothetical protein
MSDKFNTFITNTEKKLRNHLLNGEIKEFSILLSSFYPNSAKFFTKDTETFLSLKHVTNLMINIKKNSALMTRDFKSYEIQPNKIILEKKDLSKEEFPIFNVGDLLKKILKIDENEIGYFLVTSLFIQPVNYDAIQIFSIYLDKS